MVSPIAKPELSAPVNRLQEILGVAGMPGEPLDHEWMALRIWHFAETLGAAGQAEYLADLLITGLLLEHGMNPSTISQLNGRNFPEATLRAVPPLLKIGCPTRSWKLVEKGVLSYEGSAWGGQGRWVLKGQMLKPFMDEWHELGEQLVMQHLARGLVPLVHDTNTPTQIKLSGVDRKTGRKWLVGLRSCLQHLGGNRLPHLMLDA